MGLFSGRQKPTKPGKYEAAWPRESGLGTRPYPEEKDAREKYLLYTTARRSAEPVPVEDMEVMQAANSLLFELAAGTPPNELPLIQGPMDVNLMNPAGEFVAEVLITDRRILMWWPTNPVIEGQLVIRHHFDIIPRPEVRASTPMCWLGGMRIEYPIRGHQPRAADLPMNYSTHTPHFSSDGHANRRAMSVSNTLLYLEDQVRSGIVDEHYRL